MPPLRPTFAPHRWVRDTLKHNLSFGARREILKERFGVKAIVLRRKANASTPASDEIIEGIAKDCDLVFAGSGD